MPIILFFIVAVLLICLIKQKQKLSAASAKLQATLAELQRVEDAEKYSKDKKVEADEYHARMERKCAELDEQRKVLLKDIHALELQVMVDSVKVDAYSKITSDEVKNKLVMLQSKQDSMVKTGIAVHVTSTEKKKVVDSQKKQILRCFNSESKSLIESTTVKNVDSVRAKLQRAYETINKIFAVDGVQISMAYLETKYEELSLVYAAMLKEDEERERRKAIREQMVEEEKARREIEAAKRKIEKEESQFSNEVKKLMTYMQKAKDDVERQLYIDKIQELENKLKALASDKENILQREQNTRAGFVYIISNIGSFGENVYKIGMTRRLEPMDRINELSSASVPFPFDVHALIFSEDAPALETLLHHHFQNTQVNKVNTRKEFFRVDLGEIKDVVHKNHNATVKFVEIPDAVEYRETLRMTGEKI